MCNIAKTQLEAACTALAECQRQLAAAKDRILELEYERDNAYTHPDGSTWTLDQLGQEYAALRRLAGLDE